MGKDTDDGKYHAIVTMDGCGELIAVKVLVEDGADLPIATPELLKFTIYVVKPELEED